MTQSVVRIQTTNATLIFRSDSLGRRRQTERCFSLATAVRSLAHAAVLGNYLQHMHSGRGGKKERRRKRVSNAIDIGRRETNARPSINRVSWVVYRSSRPRSANLPVDPAP